MKRLKDQTLVFFIGVQPDHHRVLCIEENGRLEVPMSQKTETYNPEELAYDIKDRYIEDRRNFRPLEQVAYLSIPFNRRKNHTNIWVYMDTIDDRCWIKCPFRGLWIPHNQLVGRPQPFGVQEALLALKNKHHLM